MGNFAKGNRLDAIGMTNEFRDAISTREVPDAPYAIVSDGDRLLSILADGDTDDHALMTLERVPAGLRVDIPNAHQSVASARDGDAMVSTNGQGIQGGVAAGPGM